MAEMIGDNFLPDSIASRRRRVRERIRNVRRPIRNFREENVPGPDVVGQLESNLTDLRRRFVNRQTVLSKVKERRNSGSGSSNGSTGDSNGSDSGSSDGEPLRPSVKKENNAV